MTDLYKRLSDFAPGNVIWQPFKVNMQFPEQAEQLRTIIYSMLHETATKPLLQVKMLPGYFLVVAKKVGKEGHIGGGVVTPQGYTEQQRPAPGEVMGQEDWIKKALLGE